MNARHVRPKGQPRRSWAPLDPELPRVLPVLDVPGPVLTERQTVELLDQMDGDLFREVRRGPLPSGAASRTTAEVLEFLAPRNHTARAVARGARRLAGLALYTIAVGGLIAVAPVLHGLGV